MKRSVTALLLATAGLTGLGLFMLATWHVAHVPGVVGRPEASYALAVQTFFATVGGVLLWWAARVDYPRWQKIAVPLFAVAVLLLLGNGLARVFLPPLQYRILSRNVLAHIQPDVLAGWAVALFLAWWYGASRSPRLGWVPYILLGAVFAGLATLPDYTSAVGILLAGAIVMLSGGARRASVFAFIACAVSGMLVLIVHSPVRAQRLAALFAAGNQERYGRPLHRLALDAGGWTGVGLGRGEWAARWLTMADGRLIAAHIGEELGLLGLLAMNGLYLVVLAAGIAITARAPNRYGRLMGVAIVSVVGTSVLLNLVCLSARSTIISPTLPWVSYGGIGLCLSLIPVGILVNIAQKARSRVKANTKG